MFRVAIIYEKPGCSSPSIAKIFDRAFLAEAARLAIQEAEQAADNLEDPVLHRVQIEEVGKLRRVLELLAEVPSTSVPAAVM
jgi:hypothetical protein